jgi:hypothetical protein
MSYARFLLLCLLVTSPLVAGFDSEDDEIIDIWDSPPLPRLRSHHGSETTYTVDVSILKVRYYVGYDDGLAYSGYHDQSASVKNGQKVHDALSEFLAVLRQIEGGYEIWLTYRGLWDDTLLPAEFVLPLSTTPFSERFALNAAYLMGYGKALGMRWSQS